MLIFDAMNLFSRKSRLASCTLSLASVSTAPRAPSSSSSSGSLEAVLALDLCIPTIHVPKPSACSSSLAILERPSARHALLRCSAVPRSAHQLATLCSSQRRKRSPSTSSQQAPRCIGVTFPKDETRAVVDGVSEGHPPPRKRARRSATSVPSTSRPPPAPTSESPPSSVAASPSTSLVQPPPLPPPAAASSPLPTPYILRYQASVYHTLVLHRALVASSAESAAELFQGQDALLLTRLYFALLLSGVPVMPLPNGRADTMGFGESGSGAETSGSLSLGEERSDQDGQMDVDHVGLGPSQPEQVFAGPPFESLAHMVAVMTFRHRAKLSPDMRHGRTKPRDKAKGKPKPGSPSAKGRKRPSAIVAQAPTTLSADEDDAYERSPLGLVSLAREDLDRFIVVEDEDLSEMMDIDACFVQDSAILGAAGAQQQHQEADDECDLDSDSDEDREWKMLRGALAARPKGDDQSVSIIRPTSPVPLQLDDGALVTSSSHRLSPPIRDVTNTPNVKVRSSLAKVGRKQFLSRTKSAPPPPSNSPRVPVQKVHRPAPVRSGRAAVGCVLPGKPHVVR